MASEPKREPGVPGDSGAPVQRASDDSDAVPEHWLLEPEHLEQAEKVDRMAADVELVTLLALGGFQGRDWEYFSVELAKYGMAVIGGWMFKGMIFQKCKERGFGGLQSPGRAFTEDEVEELRGETVAKALKHFRSDVLMKGGWDSRRGASLRTYFIGQCLIRFQNIYRRWYGNEFRARRASRMDDDGWLEEALGAGRHDTADTAVDRAVVEQALSHVRDPRVKRAMLLSAFGRTQAEIAEELAVTEKTVERMLANERKRQRERRAG